MLFLAADVMSKMDSVGYRILSILQAIAYWVILVKCVLDVVKLASSGDRKSIINVILTNIMLFAAVYMTPWFFDLIKEMFG